MILLLILYLFDFILHNKCIQFSYNYKSNRRAHEELLKFDLIIWSSCEVCLTHACVNIINLLSERLYAGRAPPCLKF